MLYCCAWGGWCQEKKYTFAPSLDIEYDHIFSEILLFAEILQMSGEKWAPNGPREKKKNLPPTCTFSHSVRVWYWSEEAAPKFSQHHLFSGCWLLAGRLPPWEAWLPLWRWAIHFPLSIFFPIALFHSRIEFSFSACLCVPVICYFSSFFSLLKRTAAW